MVLNTSAVERLDNGLTLVWLPRVTAGVATVAVHVAIGFRAEPEHCDGMAHLFEHLMFQGSAGVEPGEHFHRIEAEGGRVGGHTRHDYTEFFDVVPSDAVLTAVDLEADRLKGPRLSRHTLDAQVEVIRAEVAQQVEGVTFGGFPWRFLPEALYQNHCNTHDGYGDIPALTKVTPDDCAEFFDRWYSPDRIVVTIGGEYGGWAQQQRIRDRLTEIPARAAAPALHLDEPGLRADRHLERTAANAPSSIWAAGFRLPDPQTDPVAYAGCAALAHLLPTYRPELRLSARCGWYGIPLDAHTPDVFVVHTHPSATASGADLLELVRTVLGDFTDPAALPTVTETAQAQVGLADYMLDDRLGHHARRAGATQLLFCDPLLDAAAGALAGAAPASLARAAQHLLSQAAGTVRVDPMERA